MSEPTPDREIEVVAGVIEGVTQKKPDTWQVAVKPDGSQYTKNLWTKDAELVQALTAKLGQHGAFVCGASYWTNQSGQQVRSLWISSEGPIVDGAVESAKTRATPDAAPRAGGGEQLTKEEWARKDSAAWKRMLIESAADALKHTLPSEPTSEDINRFNALVMDLANRWHRSVIAERDDPTGEDVPF